MASESMLKTPVKGRLLGCFAEEQVKIENEKFIPSPGTAHTFKKREKRESSSGSRKSLWAIVKEQLRDNKCNKEQTETCLAKQDKHHSADWSSKYEKAATSTHDSKAKQDKRHSADWFSKYEKPATSTHDSKVKQTFLKVQDADKLRRTRRLCDQIIGSTVVCCTFDSDVERVGAYLSTNGISAVKLHRNLPKLQQKSVKQNFQEDSDRVEILVVTAELLLRMNVSGKFALVNFDLPVHFSDYKRLVAMSNSAVTFINKGSAGMTLMKLVENIEVPDFVKQIADECHGRKL